eukprot:scaffold1944_cov86-Cylindrotheca_fusiformis.AAC.2
MLDCGIGVRSYRLQEVSNRPYLALLNLEHRIIYSQWVLLQHLIIEHPIVETEIDILHNFQRDHSRHFYALLLSAYLGQLAVALPVLTNIVYPGIPVSARSILIRNLYHHFSISLMAASAEFPLGRIGVET